MFVNCVWCDKLCLSCEVYHIMFKIFFTVFLGLFCFSFSLHVVFQLIEVGELLGGGNWENEAGLDGLLSSSNLTYYEA